MGFETKDSGERAAFESGMVRDTQTGKPRYGLIPRGPLKRLAELYARGAEKYDARNWEKADSVVELERFGESAFRHLMQLLDGETDEDHGAAVVFNVFAIMWLTARLEATTPAAIRPAVFDGDESDPSRRRGVDSHPVYGPAAMRERFGCTEPDCREHGSAQPPIVFAGAELPSVPDVAGRDLRACDCGTPAGVMHASWCARASR